MTKFVFFFSVISYGITRDLIWSGCWLLLLTAFPVLGDSGTATFHFSDQALGLGMFFLSVSTSSLFISDCSLCWGVWVGSCDKMPSCVHERRTEGTRASHTCPCPCCGGSVPLCWNLFQRFSVWWNLHAYSSQGLFSSETASKDVNSIMFWVFFFFFFPVR